MVLLTEGSDARTYWCCDTWKEADYKAVPKFESVYQFQLKLKKTSANFVKCEITSQLLFAVTVLNLIFQWCLQFSSAFICLYCIFCNFSVLQLCWFISDRMLFLSLINSWSEINWRCAVLKHYWIFYCNITATVLIFTARSIRFNALWTKFRLTNLFIYKVNPC